jgi:hypothetical protein
MFNPAIKVRCTCACGPLSGCGVMKNVLAAMIAASGIVGCRFLCDSWVMKDASSSLVNRRRSSSVILFNRDEVHWLLFPVAAPAASVALAAPTLSFLMKLHSPRRRLDAPTLSFFALMDHFLAVVS